MKTKEVLGALLVIVTLIFSSIPLFSIGAAPLGPPPPNGDWVVSDQTDINDTAIELNGNLTITSLGSLNLTNVTLIMNGNITVEGVFILRNTTLIMNCTIPGNFTPANGKYGIVVESGGTMHVLDYDNDPKTNDYSLITSGIPDGYHRYTFWVKSGSNFRMENSVLSECGYGTVYTTMPHLSRNAGLFIDADNTQIKNCTINRTRNGVILNSSENFIFNCLFIRGANETGTVYGQNGLYLLSSHNNSISDCKFNNFESNGLLTLYSNNNTINRCSFYKIRFRCTYIYYSNNINIINCTFEDPISQIDMSSYLYGIYCSVSNNLKIINNTGKMIKYGLFIAYTQPLTIQNFSLNGTYVGIYLNSEIEQAILGNISIQNVYNPYPGVSQRASGIILSSPINGVNITNCNITGLKSPGVDGIGLTNAFWFINNINLSNCSINCSGVALAAHSNGQIPPIEGLIYDITIENSTFLGGQHAFASLIDIYNWSFTNCSFKKSLDSDFGDFEGVSCISSDAITVEFNDCDFNYIGSQSNIDGFVISGNYVGLGFNLELNECNISGNSKNGINIYGERNLVNGVLVLNNCTIIKNSGDGIGTYKSEIIFDFNNCNISNNSYNGILLEYLTDSTINLQSCTISGNDYAGMSLYLAGKGCDININSSTFQKNKFDGLKTLESNSNFIISESNFIENSEAGLDISGCIVDIEDSSILNNFQSGLLLDISELRLNNSDVSSNHGSGINSSSCQGTIQNNKIINNFEEGLKILFSQPEISIINNTIRNNTFSSGYSEMYMRFSSGIIEKNTFTNGEGESSEIALKISECQSIKIQDNIFDGEYLESIIDIGDSKVHIEKNTILESGTQSKGIYSHDESVSQIINNTITGGGISGIYLDSETTGVVYENTITGWNDGITVVDTSITLSNNTIQSTGVCGVQIKVSADVLLIDNTFNNNYCGVSIEGSAQMDRNVITNSGGSGIFLKDGGRAVLHKNILTQNNVGVIINDGTIDTNYNILTSNRHGYYLINTKNCTLTNDEVKFNEFGLEAEDSSFIISKFIFSQNDDTILLRNSNCNIYISEIYGSENNFILDDSSHCKIINTAMDDGTIDILDTISDLEQQWYLNITLVNVDLQPVADMDVMIIDKDGTEIYNVTTSVLGKIELLNLTSIIWTSKGQSTPNPYEVVLSKSGYGTTVNDLEFVEASNVTFTAYKLSDLITHIEASDVLNDQGGSIILNWSSIPILNFHHFNIYMDHKYITSVTGLSPFSSNIYDQAINSTIISEINGEPLDPDRDYYFVVTIVDSNDREDWVNVLCSNRVIPLDNLAPTLVQNLTAYDTPNDNGGSITITWESSKDKDFAYYELYYSSEIIKNITDLQNLTPKVKSANVNSTMEILFGLIDNTSYYFVVIIYDLNDNVDLSFKTIGPISSFDNLPPIIRRSASEPPNFKDLEYDTDDREIFKIYMNTNQEVEFQWYLDGIFQDNVSEPYFSIIMSDLTLGDHNVTVIANETSELYDSLTWDFTVTETPVTTEENEKPSSMNTLMFFWVALIVLIFIFVILTSFTVKYTQRYREAKKMVNVIPTLENNQTIAMINEKRELGDKYILGKMVKDLPEALKNDPDKLFMILKMLAKDDTLEIREKAAQNIAVLLDKNPKNAFLWFQALQFVGVKPEIYLMISQSSKNEIIKSLGERYHLNLTIKDDDKYQSALEITTDLFKQSKDFKYGNEMSLIYSTLNDFNKFRTISKISTSKPAIDRIQNLRYNFDGVLYPDTLEIFIIMGMVAETLGKYEKVEGVDDKLSYLSLSLNSLEEASRLTREKLLSPERELFILVLNTWRNIISHGIRELRGRADLSFSLVSKEVVDKQDVMTLMLEIENEGRNIAERVLVEIVPSNDYVIRSAPQELGTIGQKKKKEVTFELLPRTTEAFRVEFAIRYDDSERKGKSVSFGDLVTFIEIGSEFKEIPNPYIVGTPIRAGSKLFVGRKDLIEFIQKNIKGSLQENIIVLIGHRRTGKTTLLQQLPIYLDKDSIPVYIDIQGIIDPGMDAFFYLIATEIVTAMQGRGIDINCPEFEKFEKRPSFYFEYEFLKEVYTKLDEKALILLFDEFEELEVKVDSGILDKNIFSYLRHLMQHTQQLAFVFTGSSRLEDLKTDYWSIMFNIALYKRISFLSEDETKELITEPVKSYNMIYDSLAIEKIYRLTSGHPYFTQLLCHALVNHHNREEKNYITIQDVNGELNRILERGQMHFDFIWDKASEMERLVMTAFTRVYHEDESVTVSSIVNKVSEFGINIDPKSVSKTLDILIGKDIIAKIMSQTVIYEFKIDLIRIWLEQTKHLDQVLENYKSRM